MWIRHRAHRLTSTLLSTLRQTLDCLLCVPFQPSSYQRVVLSEVAGIDGRTRLAPAVALAEDSFRVAGIHACLPVGRGQLLDQRDDAWRNDEVGGLDKLEELVGVPDSFAELGALLQMLKEDLVALGMVVVLDQGPVLRTDAPVSVACESLHVEAEQVRPLADLDVGEGSRWWLVIALRLLRH